MNAHRATKAALDPGYVLDVIDVAMGKKQEPQLDSLLDQPRAGAVRSVEEHPALGRLQGVAIRLKNSASETSVFDHGRSFSCSCS